MTSINLDVHITILKSGTIQIQDAKASSIGNLIENTIVNNIVPKLAVPPNSTNHTQQYARCSDSFSGTPISSLPESLCNDTNPK
jgi:hypothetical protein